MLNKEIDFIKNLLIKLDLTIDAEHEKTNITGLNLILDFTEEKRKQDILKALNILNNQYVGKMERLTKKRSNK